MLGFEKMTMSKILSTVAGLTVAAIVSVSAPAAFAASEYPINHPKQEKWSFAGPFGHWDLGQLQRGFKVYREVCAGCHSIDQVAFRNLVGVTHTEEQVKALAEEIEVEDGPGDDGEMFG